MKKLLNKLRKLLKRSPRYHAYVTVDCNPQIKSFSSRKDRELYIVTALSHAAIHNGDFWVDALIDGKIEWTDTRG